MGRPQNVDSKHIGADVESNLAEQFSAQCKERGFIISRVLSQFVTWWVQAPEELQKEFYHARSLSVPEVKVLTTPEEVRLYVESLIQKHSKGRQQRGK